MKAKLLLAATLLVAFFGTVSAQDYHPFLNNSSWVINDLVACCRPAELRNIEEGTPTVIGAYTYMVFTDPFAEANNNINTVYLREDVAAQKVYKLVDGTDVLLYDFSLQSNDVISQYGFTFTATVDQVAVNGGMRKRITLHSVALYHEETLKMIWIEGVGTTAHPFYPDYNMRTVASSGGGYQIRTRCSFQNGEHVFGNANCAPSSALSTTSETLSESNITFTPNPMATQLTISSALELQNASLKLYNAQGQLVRETANLNGKLLVINRENLATGLYVAQLSKDGKLLKTAKLMVN